MASKRRHSITARAVKSFKEGDGPALQEALEKYSENKASYVEEFWSDAYLVPSTSPVLNLNPFFLLEDGPDQKTATSQVGRAATLVFSSLKFASLLFTESLHPDLFRGTPLCMAQFRHIFGSARIPIQSGGKVRREEKRREEKRREEKSAPSLVVGLSPNTSPCRTSATSSPPTLIPSIWPSSAGASYTTSGRCTRTAPWP